MNDPEKGEMVQYLWATKKIKFDPPKSNDNVSPSIFIKGIEGTPLRIETEVKQSGMSFTMIMEAEKVEKKKFDKSLFEVPSDYTVKDFDPEQMFGR